MPAEIQICEFQIGSISKTHLELLPLTSPNILSGARALLVSVHDPSE